MTRNLSFLLFKSTRLGTIFEKRYACGGLYAADFKIFFVKVDNVTIILWYIAKINGGLQLEDGRQENDVAKTCYIKLRDVFQ